MADPLDPQAVLVTGVFGVGKTSVVDEMAEMLEEVIGERSSVSLTSDK